MPYSYVDGSRTFGDSTEHRLYHVLSPYPAAYNLFGVFSLDQAYPQCCTALDFHNRKRNWLLSSGVSARPAQASRFEVVEKSSQTIRTNLLSLSGASSGTAQDLLNAVVTNDDGTGQQRWKVVNQGSYHHMKITPAGSTEKFLGIDTYCSPILSDAEDANHRWSLVTVGGLTTIAPHTGYNVLPDVVTAGYCGILTYQTNWHYAIHLVRIEASSTLNGQYKSVQWSLEAQQLGVFYHLKPITMDLTYECRFFKTVQKNLLGLTVEATPPAAATVITSAQPATTSAPLWRLCSSTNAQAMLGAGTLRNEVEAGVHSFAQCEALATALGVPFDPYFGIDTCTTVDYAALGNTLVCGYWAPAQFSTHGCGDSSYSNTGAVIPFPVGRSRNGATLWSQIAEHGGIGDSQYGGTCPDLVGGTGCRLPFGGTAFGLSVYPASGAWCYQSDSSLDYFAHTIPLLNPDVRRLYSMYPMENAPPPPSPPHGPPPPSSPHMPHCLNPRDGTANTRIALNPEANGNHLHTTNGVAGAIFSVQNAQIYEFTTTEPIYFSTDATFVTETAEPCTLEVGYYSSGSFVSISQSQYGPNDAPLSSGSVSARTPYTNEDGGCNNLEGDQSQCCAASDTSASWNGQPCQWRNDGPVGCEPQSVYVSAGTAFSCPDRFWAFRTTSACADGTAIKLNAVGQNILNRGIVFYIVNTCPADTADPPPPPSRRKRMLVEEGREGKVEPFIRRKLMKGLSGKNKRM